MKSSRTKELIKKRNLFAILSSVLWVGTLIVMVCCGFKGAANASAADVKESSNLVGQLLAMSTTAIIGLVISLLIKDKMRTCIWMGSVIFGSILFGATGMYIILALWLIDEYVLHALYKKCAAQVVINKEIDGRA